MGRKKKYYSEKTRRRGARKDMEESKLKTLSEQLKGNTRQRLKTAKGPKETPNWYSLRQNEFRDG